MSRERLIRPDAIPMEFWKITIKDGIEWLTKLFNSILKSVIMSGRGIQNKVDI